MVFPEYPLPANSNERNHRSQVTTWPRLLMLPHRHELRLTLNIGQDLLEGLQSPDMLTEEDIYENSSNFEFEKNIHKRNV